MEAYFDNSATTRCYPEVAEIVVKTMTEDFGNPSAMHLKGVEAEKYVREAAQILAKILKVNEKEIIFTSGGTESNNLALFGGADANKRSGNHIITTSVEHAAVGQPAERLEQMGYEVTVHQNYYDLTADGVITQDKKISSMYIGKIEEFKKKYDAVFVFINMNGFAQENTVRLSYSMSHSLEIPW